MTFRSGVPVLFIVCLFVSGCSIPTQAPEWDSRWVVPAENTSISVSELLPAGVAVVEGVNEFDVQVDPFSFSRTLADACPPCSSAEGQTVPKPAFTFGMGDGTNLPADVVSVDVATAGVQIVALNGFDFDPIRPGMGNTGTITIRLYDGDATGRLLDELVIDGATEAFPPGGTRTWTLSAAGVIGTTVSAEVVIDSPAGDPVTIQNGTRIDVDVVPQQVRVRSVEVDVSGQGVTIDPVNLDLQDIEAGLVDRVDSGAFELDLVNTFGVSIDATFTVTAPGASIVKPVTLPASPVSTVRVEFTQDELRSILGQPGVILSGSGTIGSTGPVTITPDQVLDIDSRIDVTVSFGG